jgi:hypothetical protein
MTEKQASVVEVKSTSLAEIYARAENRAWCRLFWEDSGQVIIVSDYGNWAYWWGHRGKLSVPEFLASLECDYMGRKMLGADLYERDDIATVKSIRDELQEELDSHGMLLHLFEEETELLDKYCDGEISFEEWAEDTSLSEPYESAVKCICSEWQNFWDKLWVPLVQSALVELCCEAKPADGVES